MDKGLVHIYCGDGKGKTTASIGLIIRALGSNMKVVLVQFLKNRETSELKILNNLNGLTILRGKKGNVFSFSMTEEEKSESRIIHNKNLNDAINMINTGEYNMLVLDEIIGAYNKGLVDKHILINLLDNKPDGVEIVLTGRNPSVDLISRAHYVSEIKKIKHPYDSGISSRIGIER